jgi:hypothetical protein
VEEFAEAIDETLRTGRLHPQTIKMCEPHSEAELLDFLRRVASLLDRRRPWPRRRFTRLDAAQWNSFDKTRPIARVNRPTQTIESAIGYQLGRLPAGGDTPGIVLMLRSGAVVALLGSTVRRMTSLSASRCSLRSIFSPSSATQSGWGATPFTLWVRDPGNQAAVVEEFRELTGFSAEEISLT